jgi:hypothetical protein
MKTERTEQKTYPISQEKLFTMVRALLGGNPGREDDEHPLPPGPWDPIIRSALERTSIRALILEGWDAVGGERGFGDEVALNPQPLPPRWAFLVSVAETVIGRAELMKDMAGAAGDEGEKRGIIIVSGYISRFVDDFCGTGFKLKYPFPGPRPHWFAGELEGTDLVVMAAQFEQAADEAYSPELSKVLAEASAKLIKAGLSKM